MKVKKAIIRGRFEQGQSGCGAAVMLVIFIIIIAIMCSCVDNAYKNAQETKRQDAIRESAEMINFSVQDYYQDRNPRDSYVTVIVTNSDSVPHTAYFQVSMVAGFAIDRLGETVTSEFDWNGGHTIQVGPNSTKKLQAYFGNFSWDSSAASVWQITAPTQVCVQMGQVDGVTLYEPLIWRLTSDDCGSFIE